MSAEFVPDAALLAAAAAEGTVTTIGLSNTRCNYGEVIRTFKDRTGLEVGELDPEATAEEQLEALALTVEDPSVIAPDVIDVELAFGAQARARDLLQPYRVSTWESIPAAAKDPDGFWFGGYYGVMAFEVNTDVVATVPPDWTNLLEVGYAAQVALSGDPQLSGEAMYAVYAAALANGGGPDDARPGLEFFADLNSAGTFLPVVGKTGTVAAGETPIRLAWTYNALADRDALQGTATIEVVVPASGRLAGVSVQALGKNAPHPNAAKLWLEFLASDEGQALRVDAYCHPIRLEELVAGNRISAERLALLPDAGGAVFPTLAQTEAAETLIRSEWQAVVGVDIICSLDCEEPE
jgi:putative spermidine/putrescine transport system substrate-binding protein